MEKKLPTEIWNDAVILFETSKEDAFKVALDNFSNIGLSPDLPKSVHDYLEHLVEYTSSGGKFIRGHLTAFATLMFAQESAVRSEAIAAASLCGWACEILQASFLVADDIMDESPTRRGKPSWFAIPGHGLSAVNDAYLLLSAAQAIIEHAEDILGPQARGLLIRVMNRVAMRTELGQLLDSFSGIIPDQSARPLQDINDENSVARIHTLKTSYYTIYLPMALGFLCYTLSLGPMSTENRNHLDEIEIGSVFLGRLFQIQDDYLDCYGDVEVVGKPGRDIAEGKLSALLATVWPKLSSNDRQIIQNASGKSDEYQIDRVRDVYERYNVKELVLEQIEDMAGNVEDWAGDASRKDPTIHRGVLCILHLKDKLMGRKM